jgi:integrase/recombinase XerD
MQRKTRYASSTRRSLSFSEAINSFLLYLAVEKGHSTNYQELNRRSLQEFAAWCNAQGVPDPGSVQIADLTKYLCSLKSRDLAPSSLKIAINAIKQFYRFLCSRFGLKRDPAEPLRTPNVSSPLPRTLNQEEISRLLATEFSQTRRLFIEAGSPIGNASLRLRTAGG